MKPQQPIQVVEDDYRPQRTDFFPHTPRYATAGGRGETGSTLKAWVEDRGLDTKHPITSMMRATGIPRHVYVD